MLTPSTQIKFRLFVFENILMAEDPLGQAFEKGYLGIFTLKRVNLNVLIFLFRMGSESNL